MSRDGRSRFRITTWPAEVVGSVGVHQARHKLIEPGVVAWEPRPEWRGLEDEAFLRSLLDLDVEDEAAIVEYLNDHGVLTPVVSGELLALDAFVELIAESSAVRAKHGVGNVATIAEVRFKLQVARALTQHWLAHVEGNDVRRAWTDAGFAVPSQRAAWEAFTSELNRGLRPFQTLVVVEGLTGVPRDVDLFSGLCLQLRDAITEALPPSWCANETCGRPFIRQEGRAEYGQYRTKGVQYCSRNCARAQAQREYRRRQR